MIAETISVGTELLLGQTLDTDAVFIAQMLSRLGIGIYFRTTVGDNPERMKEAIRLALSRADLIITIGGLGPTMDDLTKEMVADVLDTNFIEDAPHAQWLREIGKRRGWETLPESFYKQALIPEHGQGIPNPNGTALGSLFEKDGKIAICLPGPPNELIPMVEESVEPYLIQHTSGERAVIQSLVLRVVGMGESLVEERVKDLMHGNNPTVAPYAKTGEMHLRITARAPSQEEAFALIKPIEEQVRERLGDVIYGVDAETLEAAVVKLLKASSKQLTLAESCTGGLIAKRITDVPDSSQVFNLGFVTYSNAAKEEFLAVPAELLVQYGAVSAEVACAMAEGARQAAGTDIAISVTGIAGPGGGSEDKPVGTVHIGLAWNGGVISEHQKFPGRRADVRQRASQSALALVRRFLLHPNDPQFTKEEK